MWNVTWAIHKATQSPIPTHIPSTLHTPHTACLEVSYPGHNKASRATLTHPTHTTALQVKCNGPALIRLRHWGGCKPGWCCPPTRQQQYTNFSLDWISGDASNKTNCSSSSSSSSSSNSSTNRHNGPGEKCMGNFGSRPSGQFRPGPGPKSLRNFRAKSMHSNLTWT